MILSESLDQWAKKFPNKPAYIFSKGTMSFKALSQKSVIVANNLIETGISRGDRIAFFVKPSPEFFVLAFAFIRMGAVPIFIDPGMGLRNIKKCLASACPDVFVGIPLAQVARILFGWGRASIKRIISVGPKLSPRHISFDELLKTIEGSTNFSSPQESDLGALVFTSGSTGTPKAVEYSHSLFSAQVDFMKKTYDLVPEDIELATFPLFAFFDPALGITAVIPEMDFTRPGFVNPENIIGPIKKYSVTHMFGSPALLKKVGDYAIKNNIQLPSLKRILSAGAPVSPKILKMFASILKPGSFVFTPYGATEALPVSSIRSDEILNQTSIDTARGRGVCVGKPLSELSVRIIKISDEVISEWSDSLVCPMGEVGEIIVKGANVSACYHDNPTANDLSKIKLSSGEFFHRMGDLGYLDSDGRLWVCGRKSHRVKSKSGDLYTLPCEGVFNSLEGVYRTALVGVPNGDGVNPVLCVETEKDKKVSWDLLEWELRRLAKQHRETKNIHQFLKHPKFPVDVRHNAKIFREKLAVWAERKLS